MARRSTYALLGRAVVVSARNQSSDASDGIEFCGDSGRSKGEVSEPKLTAFTPR